VKRPVPLKAKKRNKQCPLFVMRARKTGEPWQRREPRDLSTQVEHRRRGRAWVRLVMLRFYIYDTEFRDLGQGDLQNRRPHMMGEPGNIEVKLVAVEKSRQTGVVTQSHVMHPAASRVGTNALMLLCFHYDATLG
jgi:hypothetical protein